MARMGDLASEGDYSSEDIDPWTAAAERLTRRYQGRNPVGSGVRAADDVAPEFLRSIPYGAMGGLADQLGQGVQAAGAEMSQPEIIASAPTMEEGRDILEQYAGRQHRPEGFWGQAGSEFGRIASNPANWAGPGSALYKAGFNALSAVGGEAGERAAPAGYEGAGRMLGSFSPMAAERALPFIERIIPTGSVGALGAKPPPSPQPPKMGDLADQYSFNQWTKDLPRANPAKGEVPTIRGMGIADAIAQARTQAHLVPANEGAVSAYTGGPQLATSKPALNKIRRDFDAYVAADPRGADWYDRYRAALNRITGGDTLSNQWASAQHGQWSAGVHPESELAFVLRENNAAIAGVPALGHYPAQHDAFMRSIAARDPNLMQLGDKTGEYARLVNPNQPGVPGATGVNDFRHSWNLGYRDPEGNIIEALSPTQHRFADYETALAVDRTNRSNLAGRSNWTGEQLQAAPWVRQKALDIQALNPSLTYEEAFQRANTTIADYLPKHTYSATYEAQPGAIVGHMPGSVVANAAERRAFFEDPRSDWATAPGGRDAIYSGLGIPETGVRMRVEPTVPMQGYYTRPDGTLELNPGAVAQPLGGFVTGGKGEPFKSVTPADRMILNAGEAVRAAIDAQAAGAWHKLWFGGPANQSNTLAFPRGGRSNPADMQAVQAATSKYGLPDVVDRGQGLTSTRFYPEPEGSKALDQALRKGEFNALGEPRRARMDKDYIDYVEQWGQPGQRQVTEKMIAYVNQTPQLRAAFNNNPYLAERALARIERDKDWATQWGVPRDDIQNLRQIVASGPGWLDRVEVAVAAKAILPTTALAVFAAAQQGQGRAEQ